MANQNLSQVQKEEKKQKRKNPSDPCPICNQELFLDNTYTQRVGLLGDFDEVIGWMCPHCESEFDTEDHLIKFLGEVSQRGEA